jgi:hypothetical protein
VHKQAGTGIWHCDRKKKPPRKRNKKVARKHSYVNKQGIRCNDVEAAIQAFCMIKMGIKHKSLEAIRLLRQADCILDELCKYIDDCNAYV